MLEFTVKGAGHEAANGTYVRTTQRCDGADVYRQAGTSYVLMRHGYEMWSLADLRGACGERWSLRSNELYRVYRHPAGPTPPPLGWESLETEFDPPPVVSQTKASLFPHLSTKTQLSEEEISWAYPGMRTKQSPGQQLVAKAISQAQLVKATSEPRLPQIGLKRNVASIGPGKAPAASATSLAKLQQSIGFKENREAIQEFVATFRVVLMRPSARVSWGLTWQDAPYRDNGHRLIHETPEGTPLARWNCWQRLRGRTNLAVNEGDRLVRVDGFWSFHDSEVGRQDGDQAENAISGIVPNVDGRAMVLMMSRSVLRPAAPPPPSVQVWDSQQQLVIDWSSAYKEHSEAKNSDRIHGWMVAIFNLDHELWYAVDGCSHHAKQVNVFGSDMGVMHPDLKTTHVVDGLNANQLYSCCVAILTATGWSPFSELSRPRTMPGSFSLVDEARYLGVPEPIVDDWPGRPRCAVPSELVPGASAPVQLAAGPRDLPSTRRKLLLKLKVPGNMEGLHLRPAGESALLVERIEPGSEFAKWNQGQSERTSMLIHGRPVPQALCLGDLLVRSNGAWGAETMMQEILRAPVWLCLVLERSAGGEEVGENAEETFALDFQLDGDSSRAVEQVQWHALLCKEEAALQSALCGSETQPLEVALSEAIQVTCSDPPQRKFHFPDALQEAQRRLDLMKRIADTLAENPPPASSQNSSRPQTRGSNANSRPGTRGSDHGQGRRNSSNNLSLSQSITPKARAKGLGGSLGRQLTPNVGISDETALIMLRKAMADGAEDNEQLDSAINMFAQASHAVKNSSVGQELLKRSTALLKLWEWRGACVRQRDDLVLGIDEVVGYEMELWVKGVVSEDMSTDEPPHNLRLLRKLVEDAQPYKEEMQFELAEAEEVTSRLEKANERFHALRKVKVASEDPKENEEALTEALDAAEALGVMATEIEPGRMKVLEWKEQHAKNALQDELYTAVRELRAHIEHRAKPGAGSEEQQRVRQAIAGAGLPFDHPLVQEGAALLKQWEQDNMALRAEGRLLNAIRRATTYDPREPRAGDLLGSAIAEVSQQGVEAKYLQEARETLQKWQAERLRQATMDLELAMQYHDEDFLQEALSVARDAGVERTLLQAAAKYLQKLRWEEEVNQILEKAMEGGDYEMLERAVRRAHDGLFVEEEMHFLRAGGLQVSLMFWANEFKSVQQSENSDGLDIDVKVARGWIRKAKRALDDFARETGIPEVATRTLERDLRRLQLIMPDVQAISDVRVSEDNLNRALGAIERYADKLPAILDKAWPCVPKGLSSALCNEAVAAGDVFKKIVKKLKEVMKPLEPNMAELKATMIQARLAGAPEPLIKRASKIIEDRDPEMWQETRAELELMVSLREADDVEELNVDGRFMRLQNAADEVKALKLELSQDIFDEVTETNMALAAERSLFLATSEATDMFTGKKPGDPDELLKCIDHIKRACISAEASALEEAKKMIPAAKEMCEKLAEEAKHRSEVLTNVRQATNMRSAPMRDLRQSIVAARESFIPPTLFNEAYAKLRKKKLEHLPTQLERSLKGGQYAKAAAFWQRGVALRMGEERNGALWKGSTLEQVADQKLDVITVNGAFTSSRCGGSFGTKTWRQNPYYIVRPTGEDDGAVGTRVTVAVAEGADMPSTLQVYVVRNCKSSAEAGCMALLAPDFEVLACSNDDDEIPDCSFELSDATEERPIFVVVSAANGELGPFQLLIEAEDPVEVCEVSDAPKTHWKFEHVVELEWGPNRPYHVCQGGGRIGNRAPELSWYRNPQFHIVLKRFADAVEGGDLISEHSSSKDENTDFIEDLDEEGELAAPSETTPTEQDEVEELDEEDLTPQEDEQDEAAAMERKASMEDLEARSKLASLPDGEDRETLRRYMKQFDTGGSGKINKRELFKACRRYADVSKFFGLPPQIRQEDGSRDRMERLFQPVEEEAERELNFVEFEDFYTRNCYKAVKATEEAVRATFAEPPPPPPRPLLMARLVPVERTPEAKAAIHMLRNHNESDTDRPTTPSPQLRLVENPSHHTVLNVSGPHGKEYLGTNEVGTICYLAEDNSKGVIVVPSLETKMMAGRYKLYFMATEDVIVTRVDW